MGEEHKNVVIAIHDLLREKNEKIAVAESLSGGNVQAMLSSKDGASDVFEGGICAYNINQKVQHLGVTREDAELCNCVSPGVAREMAWGVNKLFETNWSISTTGYIDRLFFGAIVYNGELIEEIYWNFEDDPIIQDWERNHRQHAVSNYILQKLYQVMLKQYE
jgi:PncC family amidohydrolase